MNDARLAALRLRLKADCPYREDKSLLDNFKRAAKLAGRAIGVPHCEMLNRLSKEFGFADYNELHKVASKEDGQ